MELIGWHTLKQSILLRNALFHAKDLWSFEVNVLTIVRVQNELPQEVPLEYADYFELKATKTPMRNFYFSLKVFKLGALPIIRVMTRNNFY